MHSPASLLTPEQTHLIALTFSAFSAGFAAVFGSLCFGAGWALCARRFHKRFLIRSKKAQAAEDRAWQDEIDTWLEAGDA